MKKSELKKGRGVIYQGMETEIVRVHRNGKIEILNPSYDEGIHDCCRVQDMHYDVQETIRVDESEIELI